MSLRSAETKTSLPSASALLTPVQYVKGVGPHRAEILKKLGIETVEDLLHHFPREHQDRRPQPINSLVAGRKASVFVTIEKIEIRQVGKQLGQAKAICKDSTGTIEAVWFKFLSYKYDPFSGIRRDVVPGANIYLFGAVEVGRNGCVLKVEDHEMANSEAASNWKSIRPIYPLTEGVSDRWMRQLMERVVPVEARHVKDSLPKSVSESMGYSALADSMAEFHFPTSWADRDRCRQRLAFDEFFFLELALELSRSERQKSSKGFSCTPNRTLLTPFKQQLGFDFTKGQTRSINEIFRDMGSPYPMYRLLQGDVGSGKTVVALSAALLAIENGFQVALLAPTEILAGQHFITISKLFESLKVKTALLTGSTQRADRKEVLKKLADHKIDLVVGTHAILNEEVSFKHLGLVVIDEQHRFGVRQRAKLVEKANSGNAFREGRLIEQTHPDVLVMTATPIPRTLALTLYGDLDVSVISEKPADRMPIHSSLQLEQTAIRKINETVGRGEQAFIVFPLREEKSSKKDSEGATTVKSAKLEFQRLSAEHPSLKMGLLHGQLTGAEKKSVMDAFRRNEYSVLVSTTVVEVGIDVPNATLIVIMNPERFGLAQLHQLRGRVGRGEKHSECLLVIKPEDQVGLERLQVFCDLSDGFQLAEEDLRLRGPGEILGDAQHGVPFLKVGDLLKDALLIGQARQQAQRVVNGQVQLTMSEFREINRALQRLFGDKMKLSGIG